MTTKRLWKDLRQVEMALESERDVSRAELLKQRKYEILARLDERGEQ